MRSRKEPVADLAALKAKLQEKEAAAKLNREREINKLQIKLARQEEHARKVLERKRALGGENGELRLSWGGETGLCEVQDSKISLDSIDKNANRMGSGRSINTDLTDTTDVENMVQRKKHITTIAANRFVSS